MNIFSRTDFAQWTLIGTRYCGYLSPPEEQIIEKTCCVHPFLNQIPQILQDLLHTMIHLQAYKIPWNGNIASIGHQLKSNRITLIKVPNEIPEDQLFLIWEKNALPDAQGSCKRVYLHSYLLTINSQYIRYRAVAIQKVKKDKNADDVKKARWNELMMQEGSVIEYLEKKKLALLLPKILWYLRFSRKSFPVRDKMLFYVDLARSDLFDATNEQLQKLVKSPALEQEIIQNHFGNSLEHIVNLLQELIHLHQHGYIHSDIKPENILVLSGDRGVDTARLCDFGGVCRIGDKRILFDLGYLSPSTKSLKLAKIGDDLFALGLTFICVRNLNCNDCVLENEEGKLRSVADFYSYLELHGANQDPFYPICKEMLRLGDREDTTIEDERGILKQLEQICHAHSSS